MDDKGWSIYGVERSQPNCQKAIANLVAMTALVRQHLLYLDDRTEFLTISAKTQIPRNPARRAESGPVKMRSSSVRVWEVNTRCPESGHASPAREKGLL
jgi:hypothetical protein